MLSAGREVQSKLCWLIDLLSRTPTDDNTAGPSCNPNPSSTHSASALQKVSRLVDVHAKAAVMLAFQKDRRISGASYLRAKWSKSVLVAVQHLSLITRAKNSPVSKSPRVWARLLVSASIIRRSLNPRRYQASPICPSTSSNASHSQLALGRKLHL